MFLAIDTSTRYAGVALLSEQGQLAQMMHWRSRHNHSVEVLPAVDMLLKRERVTVKDLAGIAVALGPGSFSALRVGLSLAKGLAWSAEVPLVAATTLEVEAIAYRFGGVPVCAALDAGRGQLAWALFDERDGRFRQSGEEKISDPQDMLSDLPSPTLVCGEALEKYRDVLITTVPEGVRLVLPYLPGHRVVSLAYVGMARLQSGETHDPATIQPLYLRRPTITEPRRPS